ncbi:MAG: hypothetical protein J5836_01295, partial [Clostridia bacterium]|nr:hypothetical protein [Clostridia bacterium]
KKVFPNKISVKLKNRVERFAYISGGKYYFADENFVLLRKSEEFSASNVIPVEIVGLQFDFENSELGKKLDFSSADLLDYSVTISDAIPDKFNLVKSVTVDGKKDRLYFAMVTGASLEFRFGHPDYKASKEEKRRAGEEIASNALNAYNRYLSLTEAEKSKGYVLCYLTDSLSVKIDYSETEPQREENAERKGCGNRRRFVENNGNDSVTRHKLRPYSALLRR